MHHIVIAEEKGYTSFKIKTTAFLMEAMGSTTTQALPLADFERYMLLDDQPSYPMTCHMRFWFDGVLDRIAFTKALAETLKEHPLLRSQLRTKRRFGIFRSFLFEPIPAFLFTHESEDVLSVIDWKEGTHSINEETIPQYDLRTKFFVRTNASDSLLVIRFHHCVTDGIGIFGFLESLLFRYDDIIQGRTMKAGSEPSIPDQHKRHHFDLSLMDWIKRFHLDYARITRFFRTLPTPLAAPNAPINTDPASPLAAVRKILTPSDMSQLSSAARAHGVSVNDLLLARLFRTALDWNHRSHRRHKHHRRRPGRIRMNVPVSLRTEQDASLPASNFVSMVFLDRSQKDIENETQLVKSIASEMEHIKDNRMGLALIRAVRLMMRARIFNFVFKSPMCMATIGLTNLGKPFHGSKLMNASGLLQAGNVTLSSLDTFPPVRNKTRSTISVNRYGGQLSVTVRYDSRSWTHRDAEDFLNVYQTHLIRSSTEPTEFTSS
jgi:NRPS condensation-like uncharacterized protein